MYTLITFATQWGSKHGGINSFNEDFLKAFGYAYHLKAQIVCIVASTTSEAIEDAGKANVRLVPLSYPPQDASFDARHGQAGVNQLKQPNISFDPDKTVWLGHDRITGEAAIAAAKLAGGRSAVIHHMSYDHYESYAENSQSAQVKTQKQAELFKEADIIMAVGPLLRDAAKDRLGGSKTVHMLIPGLAEVEAKEPPNTFVAFLSGRLSNDAARIKQGHLGVAAFAKAQRDAREKGAPLPLCKQPKLLLRGVDFEGQLAGSALGDRHDPEAELKKFAEQYADAVINLHALPYTQNREQLYDELSGASVAMMPSWHEGFGLVAWEAIAAGVPLIISKHSGVYRLLEEQYPGTDTGFVSPLDIRGKTASPFFRDEDLEATAKALTAIAENPGRFRKQASILKNMLGDYTWAACVEQAAAAFGWDIQKGSLSASIPKVILPASPAPAAPATTDVTQGPLRMPTKQWRAGAGMAESQLLRAEEALLEFDPARQPDVDSLNKWLDDLWQLSVRLITGAGGQGKTRLALELCHQRIESGWSAGLLENLEPNRMAASWEALRKLDQSLLIVVDYAETRQASLLALLRAALQNLGDKRVRVLLLARDGGEWWENLPSRDPQCEALLSGYATSGPFRLSPLYAAEDDRQEAFGKALRAFAKALDANAPNIVPDLRAGYFERPLYVQMAALLALYGEHPNTAQGLTKALLNHERRYWRGVLEQFNWPEPERRAEQLLALTTLAGGFATPRDAERYWVKAKGDVLKKAEFNSLFRILATLYPGVQGLHPLRPDILGEGLVAQALLRPDAETLLDAVLSNIASQTVRRNALTVLARLSTQRLDLQETLVEALSRHFCQCCKDVAAVSIETNSRLPELAEMAFACLLPNVKSQAAGLLGPLFEEESVQLAGLNCKVSEYLAEKARERFGQRPGDIGRMAEYAGALYNFAISLSRVGRDQQACEAALKGMELYRRLNDRDTRRFEPNYASSLGNYALYLNGVGRNEEALEHAREVLEIYKRLAQKNPDRFEPYYAISLNNYASNLSDIGRSEEALEHTREALEIRKRLAEKDPDRFEPYYADSLGNYALYLTGMGRSAEALDHAREALEIHKRLAEKNPDRFEPYYAGSLGNYANRLSDVGRIEGALEHARKALEIYKRLAEKNPDRFEPYYADSLGNYANRLSDVGRIEEALGHARQTLLLYRRLVQKYPERFAVDLFASRCDEQFLIWLSDESGGHNPDLEHLVSFIPSHQLPLMRLYSAFLEACLASDYTSRKDAFRQVLAYWADLSVADKNNAMPYWLCAAAWCAKFEPEAVSETQWEDSWQQYKEQRNGQLPQWLLTVASRLNFDWPM